MVLCDASFFFSQKIEKQDDNQTTAATMDTLQINQPHDESGILLPVPCNNLPTINDATGTGKNKRSTSVPLPMELLYLNEFARIGDIRSIKKAFNVVTTNGEEQERIHTINHVKGRSQDGSETFVEFQKLKLDQYRKLAALLGIRGSSSVCRNMAAARQAITDKVMELDTHGAALTELRMESKNIVLHSAKVVNRFIGIVFNETWRPLFEKVTARFDRDTFERGNGKKNERFFKAVLDKINDDTADEHLFVLPCDNQHYEPSYNEHLDNGHNFSTLEHPQGTLMEAATDKQVRNILKVLLRVRKAMFSNITASGNGEDDPWMFAADGVRKGNGLTVMTTISAYYFYMQCECYPEIIKAFTDNLKDEMLGECINDFLKPTKKPRRSSPGNDNNSSAIASSLLAIAESFKHTTKNDNIKDMEKALTTKNLEITNKMKQMEMMWRGSTLFAQQQIKLLEAKIPLLQEEAQQLELQLKNAKDAGLLETPVANRVIASGHGSDDSDSDVDGNLKIVPRDLDSEH
jgi:hypothetical protein